MNSKPHRRMEAGSVLLSRIVGSLPQADCSGAAGPAGLRERRLAGPARLIVADVLDYLSVHYQHGFQLARLRASSEACSPTR